MSNPDLNELEPGTPEWEAAVDAAQDEEDRQTGNVEAAPEGEGEQPATEGAAEDEPEQQPRGEPEAQQQPAAEPAKPAGVLSKDGTRVLPYAALKGARHETKLEREARLAAEQERDALRQQLEDMKAGKKPAAADPDDMTPEQMEEIVTDFPALAPLVNKIKKADEALKQVTAAARATAGEPTQQGAQEDDEDPLQSAIDSVPTLAAWQGEKGEQWKRAIELDRAFQNSRKWKDKPLAERFAHVTRIVADEYGIQIEDDTPSQQEEPKPPRGKTTPQKAIESAERTPPNSLSDFKGGAPDAARDTLDRLPAARQLSRVSEMSDDEIEKWLAKNGG